MTWNVFRYDINARRIEIFNIFNHYSFNRDVLKLKKTKGITKEEFEERLRRELSYYFWLKFEYETVITSFPPCIKQDELVKVVAECEKCNEERGRYPIHADVCLEVGEKIDIYEQVRLNWSVFVDYVWEAKV